MRRGVMGLFVLLVACATGTSAPSEITTELEVEVRAEEGADPDRGTLACGEGVAQWSGFARDDAETACDASRDDEVRERLIDGPSTDGVCTEQYGGPAIATVEGVLEGEPVDTTFTRTNGCGIGDWELLEPVIGPPPAWDPTG